MINATKGDVSLSPYPATTTPDTTESQVRSTIAPSGTPDEAPQPPADSQSATDPLRRFAAFFGLHPAVPRSAYGSGEGNGASAERTGASSTPMFGGPGKATPLVCREPGAADIPTTKVQPGETTLQQVAARLGLDPDALARANPQIDASSELVAGDDVALPPEAKLLAHPDVEWPACYFPERNPSDKQNRQAVGAYYAGTREAQLESAHRQFVDSVRRMSPTQIGAQWKTHREKFIALASTPGHGLKPQQFEAIWVQYWGERHDAAIVQHRAVNKALSERDPDAFSRGLFEYHEGKDPNALGAEYHAAETEEAHSAFMLRHTVKARDLLYAAEGAGKEYTLARLEGAVSGIGGAWDKGVFALETYLSFRNGFGPQQPKPKEGPVPAEPVRGPEPIGPHSKLTARKPVNDNQPVAANDNQQAVPRKMAVGDPYSEPGIDQVRRPTAMGGKPRGGDTPGADGVTAKAGSVTTQPGTEKADRARAARGTAEAKPRQVAASFSKDVGNDTVEVKVMRDGTAHLTYGDKSSTISLNDRKGNNAKLTQDLGIEPADARNVLQEAYRVSMNVLDAAKPQRKLLLTMAQNKGDPREHVLKQLNDPLQEHYVDSDAFNKPPTDGIRLKARDAGVEAPGSLHLSEYGYVFVEAYPGQFKGTLSKTASALEYQHRPHAGGERGVPAQTFPRAAIRIQDGVIVEIVGLAKGVTREKLLELFDEAGWEYKLD